MEKAPAWQHRPGDTAAPRRAPGKTGTPSTNQDNAIIASFIPRRKINKIYGFFYKIFTKYKDKSKLKNKTENINNFLHIDNEAAVLISSGREFQICDPTDFRLSSP